MCNSSKFIKLKSLKRKINFSVKAFALTLFFSCQNNIKEINKLGFTEFLPTGEANDILLK
jgi:hypothetical protein